MLLQPLGIYISVPFCRSKCTYCNFASGVFSGGEMARYVERACSDIRDCRTLAAQYGALVPDAVDSIYLGGGTPSLLPAEQLTKIFSIIAGEFQVARDAEITVECAPGTLSEPILEALVSRGVNRVSLGVQSFVDKEAAAVARLHNREKTLSDIARLRACGIKDINVDLIAGLPHQTRESWEYSLEQAIATDVPHVSVYMLEVDEDSRLGRELIAGGTRYHAHSVPDDDLVAGLYERACERLAENGIAQYEISNFAQPGRESRHNLKYWTRRPYLGFGVDAHSMLPGHDSGVSVRLATTEVFEEFFSGPGTRAFPVHRKEALEESFFLGLRLNRGINLDELRKQFGAALEQYTPVLTELVAAGLLIEADGALRLNARGRLLSNEVFEKFIQEPEQTEIPA